MPKKSTFIDLFCGCGGFSLGLERAGFKGLAAIDFNKEALQIFRANFDKIPHALEKDLTEFPPTELEELIGLSEVDLIVGGPPCQGFSIARQVDGANHGDRLKDDPRRVLYKQFLKYVEHFKPKVFVMENVLGIRTASGGIYFSKVQAEARKLGYKVHAQLEKCINLGVPQKRRRQLFVGTRDDLPGYFRPKLEPADRAMLGTTLWDAIGDLPSLTAGAGEEISEYNISRRNKIHEKSSAYNYVFNVLEANKTDSLTAHRARPHNQRDLRDFEKLKTGESSAEAMRRGVEFEFPYDKTSFKDRFTRQPKDGTCSTIVAHLSKDGLMFIHPTQNRSLTPREAARIQSFPDWFQLPVSRTQQFKAIGNAVPPLVSEAIGNSVQRFIDTLKSETRPRPQELLFPFPKTDEEAAAQILLLADLSKSELKSISDHQFKVVWYSIAFLFAGLHPDSISEHGKDTVERTDIPSRYDAIDSRLFTPFYDQSGWPVILTNLSKEGESRYAKQFLSDDEFYCCEGQRAGHEYRVHQKLSEKSA
jgi:DNA (cytosine-5)-methyltransferase 1